MITNFKSILIFFIVVFANQLFSQNIEKKLPRSFSVKDKEIKSKKINTRGEKIAITAPNRPLDKDLIGRVLKVDYNLSNSGSLLELENGDRIWQLEISTNNAREIQAQFDKYELKEGSELYIYSCDKQQVLGQYNHGQNNKFGKFATETIKGSCAILELYEPKYLVGTSILDVSGIVYYFEEGEKKINTVKE